MAQAERLKLLELAQARDLALMARGAEESPDGTLAPLGTDAVNQIIQSVQILAQNVQGLGAMQNAPKRIVRDPVTGDIVGVEAIQ
jgi:hypothetical protein